MHDDDGGWTSGVPDKNKILTENEFLNGSATIGQMTTHEVWDSKLIFGKGSKFHLKYCRTNWIPHKRIDQTVVDLIGALI